MWRRSNIRADSLAQKSRMEEYYDDLFSSWFFFSSRGKRKLVDSAFTFKLTIGIVNWLGKFNDSGFCLPWGNATLVYLLSVGKKELSRKGERRGLVVDTLMHIFKKYTSFINDKLERRAYKRQARKKRSFRALA